MDFTAKLDTKSLQQIVRLQGFKALLDPEIREVLIEGGGLIAKTASGNARRVFKHNSPGGLADSIYPWMKSQTEMEIVVAKPYGHRREHSFKGPDALGRMFPNDIPRPYLAPAMEQNERTVQLLMEEAVNTALGRVATG